MSIYWVHTLIVDKIIGNNNWDFVINPSSILCWVNYWHWVMSCCYDIFIGVEDQYAFSYSTGYTAIIISPKKLISYTPVSISIWNPCIICSLVNPGLRICSIKNFIHYVSVPNSSIEVRVHWELFLEAVSVIDVEDYWLIAAIPICMVLPSWL